MLWVNVLIGVIANKTEREVVKEFFQLFKTPWEFYDNNKTYDAVLITEEIPWELNSNLIIIYNSKKQQYDSKYGISLSSMKKKAINLEWNKVNFPIYTNLALFEWNEIPLLRVKGNLEAAGIEIDSGKTKILRIGYDLFNEFRYLLKLGQPEIYALVPTLEIHISVLRNLLLRGGSPLLEIPPVPVGFDFICCLTHDVDFVRIKKYRFDHTMFGFIYRALFKTFVDFLKRRASRQKLLTNWKAAFFLPFVYAGFVKDFWIQFLPLLDLQEYLF